MWIGSPPASCPCLLVLPSAAAVTATSGPAIETTQRAKASRSCSREHFAAARLIVVAWGEDRYGLAVATTMGLTTISLLHIVAAIEWRDPYRSVFRLDTLANRRFNLLILTAIALTFLVTTVDGLNRIFDTVPLTGVQWRACFLAVAGYFVLLFLSLALWWAIGAATGLGWSALIVAVIWGIIAAVLAVTGRNSLKSVGGIPKTTSTVKKIPDALKGNE